MPRVRRRRTSSSSASLSAPALRIIRTSSSSSAIPACSAAPRGSLRNWSRSSLFSSSFAANSYSSSLPTCLPCRPAVATLQLGKVSTLASGRQGGLAWDRGAPALQAVLLSSRRRARWLDSFLHEDNVTVKILDGEVHSFSASTSKRESSRSWCNGCENGAPQVGAMTPRHHAGQGACDGIASERRVALCGKRDEHARSRSKCGKRIENVSHPTSHSCQRRMYRRPRRLVPAQVNTGATRRPLQPSQPRRPSLFRAVIGR